MRFLVPQLTLIDSLTFEYSLPKNIPDNEFIFDFSSMTNFDPLPMLLIGSIIRRYRNNYPDVNFFVDGIDGNGKEYAGTMGFFKYISPLINLGKMPGEATGSANYIPITPLFFNELQKAEYEKGCLIQIGDLVESEASRLARIVDRGNPELHKLLAYLIREILRNTPEHAQSDRMWICGQYWNSFNLAEIAIIDEGIGIFNSITKNKAHREYIVDNASALQWALRAGISQAIAPAQKQTNNDEWANSGFGLYMVSQICKYLNGSFCIISYDNYLLIDNHGIKEGNTSFRGTAIRIRVPSDRISNAQGIISAITQKGENEAKTIRNAFKKASKPSMGLMEHLKTR